MKLSVVINTCALGPKAHEICGSWNNTPHMSRGYALANFILPLYIHNPYIDEIFVVGEWQEGNGYKYIKSKSKYFSCVDALVQRHKASKEVTGDIIVFQHDDHVMDMTMPYTLKTCDVWDRLDVVVPTRVRRTPRGLSLRKNGSDRDYIGGHCSVMTAEALRLAPWNKVYKVHTWDVAHTLLLMEKNLRLGYADDIFVYDVEPYNYPTEWLDRSEIEE